MKKFFTASLAILLCLTMFSCGKAENNQSAITNDGTEPVNARELSRINPQYETKAEKTTDSENGQQTSSGEAPKTKEVERLDFYSGLLAKNGDYYKSITVGHSGYGFDCKLNDNQLRVLAIFGNSVYDCIEKNRNHYKIISSVDELPEFVWEIKEISGNVEKIVGNEKGIDASIFEDNVIIFTTRMYGLLRTPVGFKNLAFRDGKMVIVADLDDNEMDGCTQMDYYLDFIIVPKSEIPEGTAKDGRIEILDRYLRSATNKDGDSKNDNNNPSQSSGIKRETLSEEQ